MPARRAAAAAIVFVALVACASWGRRNASSELADAAPPRGPRVFATGLMSGFVAPCGCERGQYGGLARRATYLRRVARGADDLRVDLGNLVTDASPAKRPLVAAALEGLAATGYDALVPGEG